MGSYKPWADRLEGGPAEDRVREEGRQDVRTRRRRTSAADRTIVRGRAARRAAPARHLSFERDPHLLEARGISKSYGPVQALLDVDFSIAKGEIVALAGENGSGKSTLAKILAGAIHADGGEILIDGEPRSFSTPREALDAGIALVTQEPTACPSLSVAENLLLTRLPKALSPFRRRRYNDLARPILELIDVHVDPGARFDSLRAGDRELVEVGKALAADPRVLILDESTSRLGESDVARLFGVLRGLRERGMSIVLITHRLPEVDRARRPGGRAPRRPPRRRHRARGADRGEARGDDGRPRAGELLPQARGRARARRPSRSTGCSCPARASRCRSRFAPARSSASPASWARDGRSCSRRSSASAARHGGRVLVDGREVHAGLAAGMRSSTGSRSSPRSGTARG